MKFTLFFALTFLFSQDLYAKTCVIKEGAKSLPPKNGLTVEACTELAVKTVATDAKLKNTESFKIEYGFDSYQVEMIVSQTKFNKNAASQTTPMEKR